MYLSCEKCQTVWRLDEKHLALGGRVVRCTACGNTWFEKQVHVPGLTPEPEAEKSFAEALAEEMAEDGASRAMTTMPPPETESMPAYDAMPGGLGANAFGAAVFALLFCATLSGLLLFKNPIVTAYPPMAALYAALGADLRAPGEGLALSALSARRDGSRIDLKGRVSNTGKQTAPYPAFHVTLRGAEGAFLKDWKIVSQSGQLAPGETIPLELNFRDVPDGGHSVDIRVAGK